MSKLQNNLSPEVFPTSTRLPLDLYERLVQKSEEMGGISISKTIQILLESALEHSQAQPQLKYMVLIHSLIQEALLSLVEDAKSLIDRAEKKAEKVIVAD